MSYWVVGILYGILNVNSLLDTSFVIKKWAEEQNRYFLKETHKWPIGTKRCSTSLTIRKIQIKTAVKYYVMLVRMAGIKKAKNNKCWQKCEEKRTLRHRDIPDGSTVKNLWAMQETCVICLGWEDPLEDGMATHSSNFVGKNPVDRGAWKATVCELQRVRSNWAHATLLVEMESDGATAKNAWRFPDSD